jgi:predicted nucleotidyltransferase component of viral defense system
VIDINRHKFLPAQILREIFSSMETAHYLGFKGGTALMFSHKLCALLDRSSITSRDIFDTWFFMDKRISSPPR